MPKGSGGGTTSGLKNAPKSGQHRPEQLEKMELVFTQQISKVKQLADAISEAISKNEYREGEPLPSINQLSKKYGISRDTVFKAFGELKRAGIVDSTPTKGYYVCNGINKVLLLLDIYSPFKCELHQALTHNLPLNYKIDLYFHDYNEEKFNKIVLDSVGRYNAYLIMNYRNDRYSEILDELDENKVMLLDFGKFEKDKFAYVCQGFDSTLYDCLKDGLDLFRNYKKLVFVYPDKTEHPSSCIPYFKQFCCDFDIDYEIVPAVEDEKITKGTALLIVKHSDLIDVVKTVHRKQYRLGKDVGAVVFNDEPMLEIIDNGIAAISTDFRRMGEVAAGFIKTRDKVQTYIPTKLIKRPSL